MDRMFLMQILLHLVAVIAQEMCITKLTAFKLRMTDPTRACEKRTSEILMGKKRCGDGVWDSDSKTSPSTAQSWHQLLPG